MASSPAALASAKLVRPLQARKTMRRILSVAVVLLLSACASPRDDLAAICDEATKLTTGRAGYEGHRADAELATVFASRVSARLGSSEIERAWSALGSAETGVRYEMMRMTAAEVGVPDWECPALREVWPPEPTE